MIKEDNLFLIENDALRSSTLIYRIAELVKEYPKSRIISFTSDKADKGMRGAVDFFLEVEENFTKRASKEMDERLIIVLNNVDILFKVLPSHYKTLLVGFVLTAQEFEEYNTEIVLASKEIKSVNNILLGI